MVMPPDTKGARCRCPWQSLKGQGQDVLPPRGTPQSWRGACLTLPALSPNPKPSGTLGAEPSLSSHVLLQNGLNDGTPRDERMITCTLQIILNASESFPHPANLAEMLLAAPSHLQSVLESRHQEVFLKTQAGLGCPPPVHSAVRVHPCY